MDSGLIDFAERRALALRLTYNRYLWPRRLLARVLAVEHDAMERMGPERTPPTCFGQFFAGFQDSSCAVCQLATACLVRTTAEALPEAEKAVGQAPSELAAEMDVPLLAVGLMHALRDTLAAPKGPEYADVAMLKHGFGRKPVADISHRRIANPRRRPIVQALACMFGAQAADPCWPPAPRPSYARFGSRVDQAWPIHLLARVPPRLTYGSPVWTARVRRERARNMWLGWLPDGTVLRRLYKGEMIAVRVFADRLIWRGETFATLYEICKAVCGSVEKPMGPSRTKFKSHGRGTRFEAKYSAATFFKPCSDEILRRAAVLQHMRLQHGDKRPMLPARSDGRCPRCDENLAPEFTPGAKG